MGTYLLVFRVCEIQHMWHVKTIIKPIWIINLVIPMNGSANHACMIVFPGPKLQCCSSAREPVLISPHIAICTIKAGSQMVITAHYSELQTPCLHQRLRGNSIKHHTLDKDGTQKVPVAIGCFNLLHWCSPTDHSIVVQKCSCMESLYGWQLLWGLASYYS